MQFKPALQIRRFSGTDYRPMFEIDQVEEEIAMSIWNELLFLQGHVVSPRLALALADAESAAKPAPAAMTPPPRGSERHGGATACG